MGCNMMIKKLFLPVVAAAVLVLNAAEVGSVKFIQEGGNPKRFSFHKVTLQDALDQGGTSPRVWGKHCLQTHRTIE